MLHHSKHINLGTQCLKSNKNLLRTLKLLWIKQNIQLKVKLQYLLYQKKIHLKQLSMLFLVGLNLNLVLMKLEKLVTLHLD